MTKRSADDGILWEWPLVAYPFILAMALPIATLELLDMARIMSAYLPEFRGKGLFLAGIPNFALLPAFALCTYLPSRRGKEGAYLAMLGVFASVIVCFNFRGVYIRLGTFDLFGYPYWIWLKYVLIGAGCGVICGLFVNRKSPLETLKRPALYWIPPCLLILLGIASYFIGNHYEDTSMWAPTRFYVLIAAGTFLLLVFGVAEVFRRANEETRVFSH